MPYIVTITDWHSDAVLVRHAEPDIESARDRCMNALRDADSIGYVPLAMWQAVADLGHDGGKIGPLPDLALLDVERVTGADLYGMAHPGHPYAPGYERPHQDDTATVARLCDAFNARPAHA